MVLTEEQEQTKYPYASLEDAKLATEQTYYDINPAYIRNTQANPVSGLPTYINNNNGIGNNPHDAGFDQTNSQKVYRINGNENKTGLGITLKVMAGDKIDILGSSYYSQSVVNNGNCPTCGLTAANLVAAFLNAPGVAATTGTHGAVTPALVATQAGSNITSILQSNQNSQAANNSNRPKAFINYILFDEQFKYVGGGASMVAGAYTLKQHFADLQNITVPKNGYIYVYCSNESNIDVFFDNLQVVHSKSALLEETQYYPFGLTMAGISSKAANVLANKKKYNGIEFENDLELNIYDAELRELDPQIGKWWEIDPKTDEMYQWSTYASNFDNPIKYEDHKGDMPERCCGGIWNSIKSGYNKYVDPAMVWVNKNINPLTPVVELVTGKEYTQQGFVGAKPRLQSGSEAIIGILPGGKFFSAGEKIIAKQVIQTSEKAALTTATRGVTKELPTQIHHFATNKNKTFTPQMSQIASKFGLSLDGAWNKQALPHLGRHPNAYHNFVLNGMQKASAEAGGSQAVFINLFNLYVKQPVVQNPGLLRKSGW